MGRAFARKPGRGPRPRPFSEHAKALFHKSLARAFDGDTTGRDLLSNFLIAESFIGFQQNPGARHLSYCGLARADEA
jgi:hypothetical protein